MLFRTICILLIAIYTFSSIVDGFRCSSCLEADALQSKTKSKTPSTSVCYDCAESNTEECIAKTPNCPMCMISRNEKNSSIFDRRCCWSNCGLDSQIIEYEGRPAYFCSGDLCNQIGAETVFGAPPREITTQTSTIATSLPTTTTTPSTWSCYDCADSNGVPCTSITQNCPMCMVSRNERNPTVFDRRCCWWGCGSPFQVSEYHGRATYFCHGDRCNQPGSEIVLGGLDITSTSTIPSTVTTTERPSACYDCADSNGAECTSITQNCPMCMISRNAQNPNVFDRRCCWWNCGPASQVSEYDGRPTYFCRGDRCNQPGSEAALGGPVATWPSTTTTIMTSVTTTIGSTTTTQQLPFTCYDCSGPQCGRGSNNLVQNCPSCMVYRNPSNPENIERRCCWWNCGAPNSMGTHNGAEAYFCKHDQCNGVNADNFLRPAPTRTSTITTTVSVTTSAQTTVSSMTTTTRSSGTCTLQCQNGGIPETTDGCFCYCSDNTSGRECQTIACENADADQEICALENQPLCFESDLFALTCPHLCGKC